MLIFKYLGCQEYTTTWENMRAFCENSDEQTPDEIWLLQHPPVYTLGQAGLAKHLLRENGIPLVQSDRGGQITYHGPGQVIAYTLLNLRRRNLGARALVRILENTVINFLGNYNITANGDTESPGVYVNGAKIAALGLRVRRGRTYHGLSLNINMDISPFADINPCGFSNLPITQLADFVVPPPLETVEKELGECLQVELGEKLNDV